MTIHYANGETVYIPSPGTQDATVTITDPDCPLWQSPNLQTIWNEEK